MGHRVRIKLSIVNSKVTILVYYSIHHKHNPESQSLVSSIKEIFFRIADQCPNLETNAENYSFFFKVKNGYYLKPCNKGRTKFI